MQMHGAAIAPTARISESNTHTVHRRIPVMLAEIATRAVGPYDLALT